MAVTPDKPAPYAPASVIVDLIERHRNKGLPAPVDSDVLERAGVSPSLIPRTLQALATLDLIDAEGAPTSVLEGMRLAPEAEYRARMGEWLAHAYADALQFVDPATASETDVRDAFRKYVPMGQQGRMVTLFIALFRHAGIAPEKVGASSSSPVRRKAASGPKGQPRAEKVAHAVERPDGRGQTRGNGFEPENPLPADYRAALLAKFPEFDPAWPDPIKEKWFTGFEQFMRGVAPR